MTATSPRVSPAQSASVLEQLRAIKRPAHSASFFYYDARHANVAVKILPGEFYVDNQDLMVMTTLGSCIAVCLWDSHAGVGGMNHFMLPEGDGASGRYGSFAMELLINELLKRGALRSRLQAKVFGGAAVIQSAIGTQVGERNARFALDYLQGEHIAVLGQDVLGPHPRQVCFLPHSGRAMVRRIPALQPSELLQQERAAAQQVSQASRQGGTVDLF
jgi:chemotaxis protein CheD